MSVHSLLFRSRSHSRVFFCLIFFNEIFTAPNYYYYYFYCYHHHNYCVYVEFTTSIYTVIC